MDALKFSKMLSDKHITDLKRMKYKYPDDFDEFVSLLKEVCFTSIELPDFSGKNIVYMRSAAGVNTDAVRLLCAGRREPYGIKALEEEILATSAIENIDFSRESVRSIMRGFAPKNEEEKRIYGLRQGFEFISRRENDISEENIYKLYMMTVGDFLDDSERPAKDEKYRNGDVFVMSDKIEHSGLSSRLLPEYMKRLADFANVRDGMNDLLKAAAMHFYLLYLHPYFDGNGRMARLLHMWFLICAGYESTLFIPLSSYIERSRKHYYDAYTLVEENARLSGVLDITPFLLYFINDVYGKLNRDAQSPQTDAAFAELLKSGDVTEKEAQLWQFVLSAYGTDSFTTKRLEKDFANAAFATVRSFVLKFTELGLLKAQKMKNKVLYSVSDEK